MKCAYCGAEFYNVIILSPSATWSLAMVGLNALMFVIAAGETDE